MGCIERPRRPENKPQGPKNDPERPKTTPRVRKNDPKRSPRGSKKRYQTARRKKVRTKTISRPSWTPPGPISTVRAHPWGAIWEAKSAQKRNRKRYKIDAKNQEAKKPIQDDLGPVLGRSWAVLGAILGRLGPQNRAVAAVALVFLKNQLLEKMKLQEATWVDFGPIWVAQGGPKWVQNGPRGGSEEELS